MSVLEEITFQHNYGADTQTIFVHGLFGDMDTTWIYEDSNTIFFWPKNLESDIQLVKAWKFGYSSSIFEDKNNSPFVPRISEQLISCIKSNKQLHSKKIVFIAHSLGGLIVKQLIRKLYIRSHSDNVSKEILNSIKGVVFLATPHDGSHFAERINYNTQTVNQLKDKNVIGQLVPGNAYLSDLYDDYIILNDKYLNIKHKQYCEDKITNILYYLNTKNNSNLSNLSYSTKINIFEDIINFRFSIPMLIELFSTKVVDSLSSDSGVAEPLKLIEEDHISICKPRNKNSEIYVEINNFVKSI